MLKGASLRCHSVESITDGDPWCEYIPAEDIVYSEDLFDDFGVCYDFSEAVCDWSVLDFSATVEMTQCYGRNDTVLRSK